MLHSLKKILYIRSTGISYGPVTVTVTVTVTVSISEVLLNKPSVTVTVTVSILEVRE